MLWRFRDFELDARRFELRRGEERLAIPPKPLALLIHLAKRHPAAVSRDELLRVLWRGVHVTGASLSRSVYLARRTIGTSGDDEEVILTVRGCGYALGRAIQPRLVDGRAVSAHCDGPLVGRAGELEAIEHVLAGALGGRGSVVLISGEPGIGKTRLAEEIASRLDVAGACVLWGRCWETGGARAFWPWAQILRSYARGAAPDDLRIASGTAPETLRRFFPELHGATDLAPPAPHALDGERARLVLFDAVCGFLKRAAGRRPLCLLLDDLHAADSPSLLLLRFLALTVHELPLLVVATYRDAELRRRSDATALVMELGRHGASLPLGGIAVEEVAPLLDARFAIEVDARRAHTLWAITGGNPFLLGEIARDLATRPDFEHPATGDGSLPARAGELIRHRLDLLAPAGRETLRIAALVGQEFGIRLLREILRRPDAELMDRLREAADDGLVIPVAAGMRYRFKHALVRETLAEEVPSADRMALELAIGEAIEILHAPHLDAHLGELAHHFVRAAPVGGARRAVRYAEAAGRRQLEMLAYEEAAAHFAAALAALEFLERPDAARRCELLLALATCRQKTADLDGARRAIDEATALARSLRRPDLLARAALGYAPWFSYGRPEIAAVRRLEEALSALPSTDDPLRAELLARLAHILEGTGARAARGRGRGLAIEAISMARRLRDDRILARSNSIGRWTIWDPATFPERAAMTAELRAIAARLGDRELAVQAEGWRLTDALEAGDPAEASTALDAHTQLAAELRQPEHAWWNVVWRATAAVMEGRHTDADALVDRAMPIGEQVDPGNAFLVGWVQRAQIMVDRGEIEAPLRALEAIVEERRDTLDGDPYPICRRAEALVELGRAAEARADLERLAANDLAALPVDMRYGINLAACAVTCAALGDAELAELLYARLEPATGRNLIFGPGLISAGPAARYQGLLAATMRRHDLARRHFEDALAATRRMRWMPVLARTQCDYAGALLRRRGRRSRRDRDTIDRLLDEAIETATRFGLARIGARALALRAHHAATGAGRSAGPRTRRDR